MSYDLEIGTHQEPTRRQVEEWAVGQGLTVEADDDDQGLAVSTGSQGDDGYLFTVDGPFAAEPDDFAEEVAAACPAPRWMTTMNVPYSVSDRAIGLARSLARHLAETNEGAAFDPQEDSLVWPRGMPAPIAPPRTEEPTSCVSLTWFVPPDRWAQAPEVLVRLVAARCPEALPIRYGLWEPLQHRFDPDHPDAFVQFILDDQSGSGFWFAAQPSFGGGWRGPHADQHVKAEDEWLRIASIEMDFDGRVLEQDARWRETLVDLFVTAASDLGAFFAATQVVPGYTVTTTNRLHSTLEASRQSGEHFLRGYRWQGLPPVPMWLSWFGGPYRELVAPHLTVEAFAQVPKSLKPTGWRRLFGRRPGSGAAVNPQVESRPNGLFVRLSDEPRPARGLGGWPLPAALTYQARRPIEYPNGSVGSNLAQPGDEADVIPPLTP